MEDQNIAGSTQKLKGLKFQTIQSLEEYLKKISELREYHLTN